MALSSSAGFWEGPGSGMFRILKREGGTVGCGRSQAGKG